MFLHANTHNQARTQKANHNIPLEYVYNNGNKLLHSRTFIYRLTFYFHTQTKRNETILFKILP